MPMKKERKLSFFPLLFAFLLLPSQAFGSQPNILSEDIGKRLGDLARDPVWRALLHYDGARFRIVDPEFLLTWPRPTLEGELRSDVEAFMRPPDPEATHPQCRFPARYLWISTKLGADANAFPKIDCAAFSQYVDKAPAETVSLVFVSENVSSPSSMMGHAFLKLEGYNGEGRHAEHSVSYYTVIDSYNLPSLLFRSLVTGMPGLFSLTPYKDQKHRYLVDEERNVWEYELALDDFNKSLLHYHVWELKGVQSLYFFDVYNCATVTNFILSIAEPDILDNTEKWTSPTDVVKNARRVGLIKSATLFPSPRWKIKMLIDQLPGEQSRKVQAAVKHGDLAPGIDELRERDQYLALELYKSYSNYLVENEAIDENTIDLLNQSLARMTPAEIDELQFEVSDYKTPFKTPNDSQLSIGLGRNGIGDYLEFGFLPVSHRIQDDNRQYFTENGLQLLDFRVRYYPEKERADIQEFLLYSVKSINPWDRFTGGLSMQWKVGLERHFDLDLRSHQAFNIDAGMGFASAIHRDMFLYAILGLGYGIGDKNNYIYGMPEAGIIVNEVFDMKSLLRVRFPYNQLNSESGYTHISLDQAWYVSKTTSLLASLEARKNTADEQWSLRIGVNRYF